MHATVRRYEGVDESRKDELKQKIGESLMPTLSKLPGFGGYYVIESENGVFTSFGLFDNSTQAAESTRIAANWVRDEKLEAIMPNAPKITSGTVVAQKLTNGAVQA